MAWLAVDKDGAESVSEGEAERDNFGEWYHGSDDYVFVPKGSIKKLIGRDLKWEDEPVEIKDEEG